jgi:hypothetical protein
VSETVTIKVCCEKFAEEAGRAQASVGAGLYPPEIAPCAQFVPDADGETWNVYGCCGGGCYVITQMRFCPFCGTGLEGCAELAPERSDVGQLVISLQGLGDLPRALVEGDKLVVESGTMPIAEAWPASSPSSAQPS